MGTIQILASSRATWNNIGVLLFSYLGLPFATLLAEFVGERNQFAAAAFFQNRYVVILLMTIAQFFYGIAFALVPAILCAAGALLLILGFKITKEKVEKYQAEIDARV